MEGKECKDQERLKMCWRKSVPEPGKCFSMRWATLSGPVAVDEERFLAAAMNSAKRKESRKRNKTPQGTWLG